MSSLDKVALAAWMVVASTAAAIGMGLLSLGTLGSVRLCLFRGLTGIPCPGCGMGHAILLAFQGYWAESLRHHPLGIPVLLIWTFWVLHGVRNRLLNLEFSKGFPLHLRGARGPLALAVVLFVYFLS